MNWPIKYVVEKVGKGQRLCNCAHSEFLCPPMGRRDGRADAVMLNFSDRP